MQRSLGVFIQDLITVTPRLNLTLSARLDNWRNYNARNLETTRPSGAPSANNRPSLPDKENTVGSPRIAALYRLSDSAAVWGGLSWGFRAPTLNELYRQFQVGAVLTRANDALGPERLVGGEVGVNLAPRENLTWRTTWFVNRFTNPVSNVTIVPPAAPGGAETRQRQNLGRTRIIGIQTDVEYRLSSDWRVGAGYLYDVAKVREFSANPALVGNWLPQVPQHRGSLQITYSDPEIATISGSAQIVGGQYDNDQNTLWLPYYGTVDMMVSRTISSNLETFFGIQNIFDREFLVQRNPTSIGSPRLITGGLRITFSGQ
jgi:outer membrane receptor protein involved in Fe transport